MKAKTLFFCLMLAMMASCSSSKDEPVPPEEINNGDLHYLYNGISIPLWYDLTKSSVLFHVDDQQAVLSKMAALGIEVDGSMVQNIILDDEEKRFDIKTDAFYEMYNYREMRNVNANYETLLQIPELICACPHVTDLAGESIPMRNTISLLIDDYPGLQQAAEDLGFIIVAKWHWDYQFETRPIWILLCDKHTKGNIYEITDALMKLKITDGETNVFRRYGAFPGA